MKSHEDVVTASTHKLPEEVKSQNRSVRPLSKEVEFRQRSIIYPGTFDPITFGHLDMIERAAHLFDKVIVAVAASNAKQPLFDLPERIALAVAATHKYPNVEVQAMSGLLVDFAQSRQCFVILRGFRALSDFEHELQLASTNRQLNKNVETIFLASSHEFSYISASMVREIASLNGDVSAFVPAGVQLALINKYKTQ